MNSTEYAKQEIIGIIEKSTVPEDPVHARNTLEWLLKLKPDAEEALQIAAFGHDIERALPEQKVRRTDFRDFEEFKAAHSRNSAEILRKIVQDCGVPGHICDDVYRLVCLHETGGDPRSDLIKDADSISFFDVNLPLYYQRNSSDETKRRCVWGYQRLSGKAKIHVKALFYENKELETLVKLVIDETEALGRIINSS